MSQSTETRTEPNVQLFIDVLAQIEREPQRWEQCTFGEPCATAFCFAGWACVLNGWQFVKYGRVARSAQAMKNPRLVCRQAERLLGMRVGSWSRYEDEHLFDPGNTLDTLYRISADILELDESVLREKVAAEIGRLA